MAPLVVKPGSLPVEQLVRTARAAVVAAGPGVAHLASRDVLYRRDLAVTSDAQKVTLGVIAAYVVAIALLWNLPYVRWSLWPFKVCCSCYLFTYLFSTLTHPHETTTQVYTYTY